MSNDFVQSRVKIYPGDGAALTTNLIDFSAAAGVLAVMSFGRGAEILKMGIEMDNAATVTLGSFSIQLLKYLSPGLATGALTLGTITPASLVKGSVVYNRFVSITGTTTTGSDGSTVNAPPRLQSDWLADQSNKFIVAPGQQLVWNSTVAMTSGKGRVWVEYVDRAFTKYDNSAIVEVLA